MSDEHTAPPSGAASATPHITVGVTRDSQAPRADYLALAAAYGQSVSTVQRWQAAGLSEAQVRADIMDRERTHAAPIGASAPTDIDLSAKEQKQYSIGRAVLALASNDWRAAGLEREVSDTLAKRLNRAAAGFYVPTNAPLFNAATMTSTTSTKGAELVYSEYQGFVDLLRPRSVLAGLGARMESGLQGTYSFVRQTAGSSVEWVGENPGSDPTESDLTFEIVEANPKTAAGVLKYTRQQLAQSVEQFDALVRGDLVTVHAKEMDKVGIKAGSGNTPNGILGYTGTTLVAMGTNGGVVDYGDLIDLKSKIDVNNAQDLGTRAFLSTVELGALWEQTPRMSNTAGLPIMENGKIAGYRAEVSNHVPSNLTKGTASGTCHAIIHGVFSEVLFLEWGALDITVDAITLAKRGVIQVISHHMMNVEIKHPKAFAVIKDATLA